MKYTWCLAALALLAGCSDAPPPERAAEPDTAALRLAADSAAARDSAMVKSEREAALAPLEQGWTRDRNAVRISGGSLVTLRGVRHSGHEGFDRIVFDFGKRSLPNYDVEYVASPQHQCGSGEEVRLKGEAWLAIKLQPAQAHDDAGNATVAERDREPNLPALRELRLTCDFEAQVEWVAGVASQNGYRVMMLQNPNRVVVDIKH